MGGTCDILPRNCCKAWFICSSVMFAGILSSTLPLSSPVSVLTPRMPVPRYPFVPTEAYSKSLVALPINTGRTPAASGSRVPAWPTFFSPYIRRILATASWDVRPGGLRTFTIPDVMGIIPPLPAERQTPLLSAVRGCCSRKLSDGHRPQRIKRFLQHRPAWIGSLLLSDSLLPV